MRLEPWIGRFRAVLPWLATVLATLFALRRLSDPDTWWHLAAGRWIAEHRSIPHIDTLSFTVPNHPWINLQWLFDLGLYGLHQAGGATLLVLVSAAVWGLVTALLLANVRRSLGPVGASVLTVWATVIAWDRFAVRPEMVSFLLLQTLLWLFATRHRHNGRHLWFLVPVMLVWVNTHALFIIGVLVIVCHIAAAVTPMLAARSSARHGWPAEGLPPTRHLLAAGAAAILVTAVSPYGIDGMLFPLKLMSRLSGANPVYRGIGEFTPPFSAFFPDLSITAYQLFVLAAVLVVALVAVMTVLPSAQTAPGTTGREGAVIDIAGLLVFCGLLYLSLLARRNMALFAFGVAPFVARGLASVWHRLYPVLPLAWKTCALTLTALLPPAMVAAGWFIATNGFYRWDLDVQEFGTGVLDASLPVRAADFAKQQRLPPHLYNDLNSGGYLSWAQAVDGGVYIDGRLEVYDTAFFSEYAAALLDPPRWQREADRLGIETVILFHSWANRHRLIRWLLQRPQWARVYFDEVAIIFVRRAGNEALVTEAQTRFSGLRATTEERLLGPVSSWQWPTGRAEALSNYGQLLILMGKPAESLRFYERVLALGPPASTEAAIRQWLDRYRARQPARP